MSSNESESKCPLWVVCGLMISAIVLPGFNYNWASWSSNQMGVGLPCKQQEIYRQMTA